MMKTLLLRVSIFFFYQSLLVQRNHVKRTSITSHDGVVQDELNWTAEYCNEELEAIESSSPITSYNNNYTSVTEITCD